MFYEDRRQRRHHQELWQMQSPRDRTGPACPCHSETERGRDDRSVHVHADVCPLRTIAEIQAAEADMQVEPGPHRIIDRAEQLPIEMCPYPEATQIAVSRGGKPVSKIIMVARG